ncbi:hypothetical protein [Maioricimonas sp. JC845]|uniref:hypothetical protein n=1 Tax=Maioricimonas sp. JC845 TaxID=3232138 RepID=UPI00345802BB
MASTSLTIFDTGRISKLSAMMLAGVLACSSVMSPPVLAQDAAATQGETAEAADPTASLVLGDDLRAVFPDMTDELVVYLRQRRTRSVAINDMKGVDPKVAKVIRRTLARGLEGKGITSKETASTRISGRLIERQIGQRRVAVLEWCIMDRRGTELCAMRKRLVLTGPLVVDGGEVRSDITLSRN